MDPIFADFMIVLATMALFAMIAGMKLENFGVAFICLLILCGCLYVGYRVDYDNGLTVDSPGYDGGRVHVVINVTTPPPTPTPDRPGWSCTYLNENDPSSGIICLPATSGAGP